MKQTGKVERLGKREPRELPESKKIAILKCHLLSFYKAAMNHFSIGLGCAAKSGFYTATGDDQLSDWTDKFQSTSQSQISIQKRPWSLSGGLLPA